MRTQGRLILGFAVMVGLVLAGLLLWPDSSTALSPTPAWNEAEQHLIQQVDDALTLGPCDEGYEAYYQQRLESIARLLAAPEGKNIPVERLELIWEQGAYSQEWLNSMQGRNFGLELFSSAGDAVLAAVWCSYCVTYSHMPHGGFELSVIDRSGNAHPIEGPITGQDQFSYMNHIVGLTVSWVDDRWVALINHDQGDADTPYSVWHITQGHGEWMATVQFGLLPAGSFVSCSGFEFLGFSEGYQRFTASYTCVTMVPPCEYKEGYRAYGNHQHITTVYEWTGESYQVSEDTRIYTGVWITDQAAPDLGGLVFYHDGWKAYCQD